MRIDVTHAEVIEDFVWGTDNPPATSQIDYPK